MKHFLLLASLTLLTTVSLAQNPGPNGPDEMLVKQLIVQLFKGFEKGDSAMVHGVFASEVTMATVSRDKSGNPLLRRESSLDAMLKAIGTPHKEVWYEEIWNVKVQLDGDFAQAWCDYAFYVDNTFSHCGVDAFQLHKGKDGWKIFHVADTRRKENCAIPADIVNKHK
jgi:hypothetical protein